MGLSASWRDSGIPSGKARWDIHLPKGGLGVPAAATGRLHGASVPLGSPSGSSWLWCVQCGPGLGRGDPAAAPRSARKGLERWGLPDQSQGGVEEQGPRPGHPAKSWAAPPLCPAGLSGLHLLPFQERCQGSAGHEGQGLGLLSRRWAAQEPAPRAWGMLTVRMAPGLSRCSGIWQDQLFWLPSQAGSGHCVAG